MTITAIITDMMRILLTTPPVVIAKVVNSIAVVLVLSEVGMTVLSALPVDGILYMIGDGCREHSLSLKDEIATEHFESIVNSTPVVLILAPPLTHFSIRAMSVLLSVSDVPSSLARYVTYLGDSGKQENDSWLMMSLHLAHKTVNFSNIALVISHNLSSLSVL